MNTTQVCGVIESGIYWHVILPTLGLCLACLGLIIFMSMWNDDLWPLINLRSPESLVMPLTIRQMIQTTLGQRALHLQAAASVIRTIPLLVPF